LLAAGVSSTVAAKAYRLLRAVDRKALPMLSGVSCGFSGERVTGIELALSAWESDRSRPLTALTWASGVPLVTAMDPTIPGLMAH
jgi:hypothetical protein